MNNATVAQRIGGIARPYVAVFDPALMAIIGSLGVIGLITLYSAGNDYPWRVTDQIRNFGIALAVLFVAANVRPQWLMRLALPVYIIGVGLLIATEISGETVKGATRWLDIKVTRIQPSEIMKLGVPMMLAWYFHKREGALRSYDFLFAARPACSAGRADPEAAGSGYRRAGTGGGLVRDFLRRLAVEVAGGDAGGRCGDAAGGVDDVARLSARARDDADRSVDRSARQRFSHAAGDDCDRIGRRVRQGVDAGHAGASGVHSGAHQRLYFCRLLRRVWTGRQRRAGAAVLRTRVARRSRSRSMRRRCSHGCWLLQSV